MLRYVYAADLKNHPKLARTMFRTVQTSSKSVSVGM